MTTSGEPTQQEWRELARQASQEKDPNKIVSIGKRNAGTNQDETSKSPRPLDWTELYRLAVTEPDPAKLRQRVTDARNAVLDRIQETATKPSHYEERQQLGDALNGLRVLGQEHERRIPPSRESLLKAGLAK